MKTLKTLFLSEKAAPGWRFYLKNLLIGVGGISFWRGMWLLSDVLIFPDDPISSALVSIIIGLVIFVVANEVRVLS